VKPDYEGTATQSIKAEMMKKKRKAVISNDFMDETELKEHLEDYEDAGFFG
jgi:hypothetical protein